MPFDFLWHKPTPERMLGPEPTQVTSPCKFGTSGTNKTSPVVFYWLFVNWQQEFKWQKRGHLPSPSINKACFPTGSRGHRQCLGKTAEASRQQPQGIRVPHRLGFGPHRPAHSLPTPRAQEAASTGRGTVPTKGVILLPLQPIPLLSNRSLSPKSVMSHVLFCPQWLPVGVSPKTHEPLGIHT